MVRRIPYNLYGYAYETSNEMTFPSIDEDQAMVIKKIFDLFTRERLSFNQIAYRLCTDPALKKKAKDGITRVQVSRILARPEYAGLCRDKKGDIHASLMFPRIIDFYTWSKAQMQLGRRSFDNREGDARLKFPLSGQIHCTHCKASYYRHDTKYYAHKYDKSRQSCPNSNVYIKKKAIEEYAISVIFDLAANDIRSGVLLGCIRSNRLAYRRLFPNPVELTAQLTELNKAVDGLAPSSKERERKIMILDSLLSLENETPSVEPRDTFSEAETLRKRIANITLRGQLERLELIDEFIENITIFEGNVVLSLCDGTKRRVALDNMEKRTRLLRNQKIGERSSELRELFSYHSAKGYMRLPQEAEDDDEYRRDLYEIKKLHVASGKSASFKAYLPQGSMVSSKNLNRTIYLDDVYQWNLAGDYFVDLAGAEQRTTLYANRFHLGIVVLDEPFINKAWLHTAPASIKAGALEYFVYDGNAMIFAQDRNRIRAYDYTGHQRKKEIPILDALSLLANAKDIEFIDL